MVAISSALSSSSDLTIRSRSAAVLLSVLPDFLLALLPESLLAPLRGAAVGAFLLERAMVVTPF